MNHCRHSRVTWNWRQFMMWGPPVISWFINPHNYSYLRTINHSDIGVMCTNLAIERGPHIVWWAWHEKRQPLRAFQKAKNTFETISSDINWFFCLQASSNQPIKIRDGTWFTRNLLIIWLTIVISITGWWLNPTPLKHMKVSWDYYSQYMEKCLNHQPD